MKKIRLTQKVKAGGWAAKLGPADLSAILVDLYKCKYQNVIVGPGDDAGVFRYKNHFFVETVDIITPIVDDPSTFGAICAANSLSDIYAMGGKPLTALAILGFASCDFGPAVIKRLLRGALEKLKEAGACLIGGHSIEDNEFKFGFAVTGAVDRKKILRVNTAIPGDTLILTKPLGTGILTSAQKLGKMRNSSLTKTIASMLTLNKRASEISVLAGAHAATDVTGFGLLGHALNMAKSSHADLLIFPDQVPLMDRVKKFIAAGIVPKGARNNLAFCKKDMIFLEDHSQESLLALSDPQTSGGLLIALPQNSLKKFKRIAKKESMPYWIIGGVVKGRGRIVLK